ncbi:MAG TPA: hypothetical protein VMV15_09800 [Candidatus Binataceae bacterium]|nr:hypothetical protein [Candidatus Binataceae bacterium]
MSNSASVWLRYVAVSLLMLAMSIPAMAANSSAAGNSSSAVWYSPPPFCVAHPGLCADAQPPTYQGHYIGHDEPSLLFYSTTPGAGNHSIYELKLPKDPPVLPKQNGAGGTFNFQLHPAFWFGMAMCDTQSYPEYSGTCTADSDTNIFDDANSGSSSYIGKHPGAAFMEMQFYPPGWVSWANGGNSCDGRHWCAALNIDSLSIDPNNGLYNNAACQNTVGLEPVNFAFITKSGVADSAGDPLNNAHFVPNLSTDLLMKPGDNLIVDLHDTSAGFQVVIYDLTSHKTGSMTASIANGFRQVIFNPSAGTCTSQDYAFHPMYATSGPHTRVPWAAHSYNVAFADEIGHWEPCASADPNFGECLSGGDSDFVDDVYCFNGSDSTRVKVGGCTYTDADFDGACYQSVWPGSNPATDRTKHPRPILFTSPLLAADGGTLQNYSSAAMETDLPIIENPAVCNTDTGSGCTNPPPGANFYPIFSTVSVKGLCQWGLGGAQLPHVQDIFGGTSTAEYGSLLPLVYPDLGSSSTSYYDYQNALGNNPCQVPAANLKVPLSKPFGTRAQNSSGPAKKIKVVNQSVYPITIASVNSTNPDYSVINGCGSLIAPQRKCHLTVRFTPSLAGSDDGSLILNDDASNGPQTVMLIGSGR